MNKLLITGTTSGVGYSLTEYLSRRFEVIALGRDEARLNACFGDRKGVITRAVDLADAGQVDAVITEILQEYGPIGYLINNAGQMRRAAVTELTRDQLFESLQVNAIAAWQIMRLILPGMASQGFGRIINLTSGAPMNCFAGFAAYSASKAALNAITVTAAREYQQQDIRINLMSPGPVRSNMAPDAAMDPAVCHPTVDYLLDMPADGPTGRFFWLGHEIPLFPDLSGVDWLGGKASDRYTRILPA